MQQRPMQVLTIINEKGGVGKTLITMLIAAGLAIRGKRVLIIDGDPQGHILASFHLKQAFSPSQQSGLFRLLIDELNWNDVLIEPDRAAWRGKYPDEQAGLLWILPSRETTAAIPSLLRDAGKLRQRLQELEGHVDVVLIDTAPQLGLLHTVFYLASTGLLHPSQCEYLSMEGLGRTTQHVSYMNGDRKKFNLDPVPLLGVIPNMYQKQMVVHKHGLDLIRESFEESELFTPLSMRTAHREASLMGQTIYAYAPGSEAETESWALVDRVISLIDA